jgi:hypothetical protein
MLNLSYEYNDYVMGYVVSDKDSSRTLNFQFELVFSNHPTPDYVLKSGCEGDETYADWTEEERIEARNWLRSHNDVDRIEDAFTKAMYENESFKKNCGPLSYSQIIDASENTDEDE